MAVNIQKEGQRLPGFSVLPTPTSSPSLPPIILGGNVMEVDPTDTSGGTIRILSVNTNRPLGVAIDSNVRSTITNNQPGAEFVTEYNRGGLIGTAHGGGAIFRAFDDTLGMPLDTTVSYVVNQPIYAKPVVAVGLLPVTGVAQLTSASGGNVLIGRIIKVEGSGSTLAVTWISEI